MKQKTELVNAFVYVVGVGGSLALAKTTFVPDNTPITSVDKLIAIMFFVGLIGGFAQAFSVIFNWFLTWGEDDLG